ncbi:MAG: diguanylate cyclase [Burkholderiaceae bacterium]|nr:diguanylate cyclase [Burkholderiaceae bacterium]
MDAERPTPAVLAKGALRRLAQARQEPTPANFARAYAQEAGQPPAAEAALPPRARAAVERLAARATDDIALRDEIAAALMEGRCDDLPRALDRAADAAATQGAGWAQLIERLVRGLERGSRHWTGARKKDGLQRVLDGSRGDAQRLQQRLGQLLSAWDDDQPDDGVDTLAPRDAGAAWPGDVPRLAGALHATVQAALPVGEPRAAELADQLAALAARIPAEGATSALADAVAELCHRVQRVLGLRHELVDELLALCRSLTDGLADGAEDGLWVRGQRDSLRQRLDGVAGARAVRAARALLDSTRDDQRRLQAERAKARDALKQMVGQVLRELGELGDATGRFSDKVAAYGQAIEAAESLDSLAEAVREMVGESRTVHGLVAGARHRLAAEHDRAVALESRVLDLEAELRRLSDEVATDALTQVANRRGLAQAFEREASRVLREGEPAAPLAIGLIDIDNFKKLNDSLGHAAGDVALQSLAARVKGWLRPADHIARFGGEEFVLLLPATPVAQAQQLVTRLQRELSASLFMHEGQEVFVTFSAGVTAWQPGETVDAALARADEGLYEAKRTGKNRTCIA